MSVARAVVGIEWRRRTGGHRMAHAFVDDIACCPKGRREGNPFVAINSPPTGHVCSDCADFANAKAAEDDRAKPLPRVLIARVPTKTTNPLNGSAGFSKSWTFARAREKRTVRSLTRIVVGAAIGQAQLARDALLPCVVTMTRVAPSEGLDEHDGLPAALKPVADGITDALGLKNDRTKDIEWRRDQRRGKPGEYAVEVRIERRTA